MPAPIAIILAKDPVPGAVKTRLVGDRFSATDASDMARAMLACVVTRLVRTFGVDDVYIAVSPDGRREVIRETGVPADHWIDQGDGNLGERLQRLWHRFGRVRPVAFFGMDSPDVPDTELMVLQSGLRHDDAVGHNKVFVGATTDGGYWTIAAARPLPQVLTSIDWGTGSVYDQTVMRAQESGLALHDLGMWMDVDEPSDIDALRQRLSATEDPALLTLRSVLDDVVNRR